MKLPLIDSYLYSFGQSVKSKWGRGNRYEKVNIDEPGLIEKYFQLSDGFSVPVLSDYRYSIKPSWIQFKPLKLLDYLFRLDLLSSAEISFFKSAIGHRRLDCPYDKLEDFCLNVCSKHLSAFNSTSYPLDVDTLKPIVNTKSLFAKINQYKRMHKKQISNINRVSNNAIPPRSRILEIGFETGGVSIFAFDQLGYSSYGIDNNHDGLVPSSIDIVNSNKQYVSSSSHFVVGDITEKTIFEDNYFDMIYSVSVLEHIQNLDKAFLEMKRILKPGGLIVHNYAPYFSHSGAHALGIPDSPWGHVLMSHDDYLRYIRLERPCEFTQASTWLSKAVFRDESRTIKSVQSKIFTNGFDLLYWSSEHSPFKFLSHLTPNIVNRALSVNPFLSFDDLTTVANYFIARAV